MAHYKILYFYSTHVMPISIFYPCNAAIFSIVFFFRCFLFFFYSFLRTLAIFHVLLGNVLARFSAASIHILKPFNCVYCSPNQLLKLTMCQEVLLKVCSYNLIFDVGLCDVIFSFIVYRSLWGPFSRFVKEKYHLQYMDSVCTTDLSRFSSLNNAHFHIILFWI